MPTYQYRCTDCGTDLEAVQKFSDPALTECPTCHGSLRKVFNAVGIVFKGSGFYRTDSRAAASSSTPATGSDDASAELPGVASTLSDVDSGTDGCCSCSVSTASSAARPGSVIV